MTICASTQVYAVLGDPIAHSLSPALHNHWIAAAKLDAVYVALRLHGPDPRALIRNLPLLSLSGANVTIPHKEAALATAGWRDPIAERIGAANTLRFVNDSVEAFNTDAAGFAASLDAAFPDWRGLAPKACILGAGGSARAVVAALDMAGFNEIAIANRTLARIAPLASCAQQAKITAFDWDQRDRAAQGASLIINATSLGLTSKDPVSAPMQHAAPHAIAFDLVYKPLQTHFLQSAADAGARTVDGLGMLIFQAAAAFELWFGIKPDAASGRETALAQLLSPRA
jgi:shikimate dehydrogenase